ncbi:DDE-type integrase/transposase/recombinase [Microbacterium sp. zg.B96]|uniref:DDE-type integrase/transposase/recombinase n=1 Tax=Microbacterium sp. zg.B96 TaxID=2969409 RepID=UPI0035A92FAE
MIATDGEFGGYICCSARTVPGSLRSYAGASTGWTGVLWPAWYAASNSSGGRCRGPNADVWRCTRRPTRRCSACREAGVTSCRLSSANDWSNAGSPSTSSSTTAAGSTALVARLRLGLGVHVGRKRVARLMRLGGMVGVSHRRKRRGWKQDTAAHEDLVKRRFRADAPNRLWFCDITQHRARDGWVYCAAVIDAFSRRIVGWSISDRITAELVVDALEMARWRRGPEPGHRNRGMINTQEPSGKSGQAPAIFLNFNASEQ